jgi:hypothetical protein
VRIIWWNFSTSRIAVKMRSITHEVSACKRGRSGILSTWQFEGMVGRTAVMWEVFARISRPAPHFRSVLVAGSQRAVEIEILKAGTPHIPITKVRFSAAPKTAFSIRRAYWAVTCCSCV